MKNSPKLWLKYFPQPDEDSNKYTRGYLVIGGGGIDCSGATKIAARCALRSGAGLVSVACDDASLPIYATSFEAVMTKRTNNVSEFSELISDERVSAVLFGCGAGMGSKTREYALAILKKRKSCVLDADALNVFAGDAETMFSYINAPTILTPHEGEFSRIFGKIVHSEDMAEKAKEAAEISGAVVVLKGFNTVIAAPDGKIAVNDNATPYLATAGSGDALAGICAGLLAQGMPDFYAACAAVWLHAEIGSNFGVGLIAEDIADGLPSILEGIVKQN